MLLVPVPLVLQGIFFGTLDEAVAGMKEAGILEYLDPESVSGPDNSQAYEEVPFGELVHGLVT